ADPEFVRQREVKMIAGAMERALAFRERNPRLDHRFLDLKYSELTADPLGAVRRIYQHLDLPLTEPTLARMRELVNGRGRYRKSHNPTLAELGLDVLAETRRFQRYCERFGIQCQADAT